MKDFNLNMATAKDNIVVVLVNTNVTLEFLSDKPHRPFHDLSIIYRWVVNMDE